MNKEIGTFSASQNFEMKRILLGALLFPIAMAFISVFSPAKGSEKRGYDPKNLLGNGSYFGFNFSDLVAEDENVDSIQAYLVDRAADKIFRVYYKGKNVILSGVSRYNADTVYFEVLDSYSQWISKDAPIPDVEGVLYKCDVTAKKCTELLKTNMIVTYLNEINKDSYLFVGSNLIKWTNQPVFDKLRLLYLRSDFFKFGSNQLTRLTQFEFALLYNVYLISNDLIFEAYRSGTEKSNMLFEYGFPTNDISHIFSTRFNGEIELGPTTFKPITTYGNKYETWPAPSPDNGKLAFESAKNRPGSNWIYDTVIFNKKNSKYITIEKKRNSGQLGSFFSSNEDFTSVYFDYDKIDYVNYKIFPEKYELLDEVSLPLTGNVTDISLEEWIKQ